MAGLVRDAVARGAKVLVGGGELEGAVHPATVLTRVPEDAEVYRTEVFGGPVGVVGTYADDADAVALANDTEKGLT